MKPEHSWTFPFLCSVIPSCKSIWGGERAGRKESAPHRVMLLPRAGLHRNKFTVHGAKPESSRSQTQGPLVFLARINWFHFRSNPIENQPHRAPQCLKRECHKPRGCGQRELAASQPRHSIEAPLQQCGIEQSRCNCLSLTRQPWRPLALGPVQGCSVSPIWSCSVHTVSIQEH